MTPEPTLKPFQVTRRGLRQLFSSPTLVERFIAADWIELVRPGKPGREALFDYASAEAAYERFKRGEEPQAEAKEVAP